MERDRDLIQCPSEMLISPRWGVLLSVLLLANLSLVAWAAAFVPEQPPRVAAPAVEQSPVVAKSVFSSAPPAATVTGSAVSDPAVSDPATNLRQTSPADRPAAVESSSPPAVESPPGDSTGADPSATSIVAEWAIDPWELQVAADRESEIEHPGASHPGVDEAGPDAEGPIASQPLESAAPPAAAATGSPELAAQSTATEVPAGLVIVNPRGTGGTVHFLLDEEIITLEPGEFHVAIDRDERVVKFDRGEKFGVVEQEVADEVWVFAVGSRGWHFQLVDRAAAAGHLENCRRKIAQPSPTPLRPTTTE